jgi:hypothetical protein
MGRREGNGNMHDREMREEHSFLSFSWRSFSYCVLGGIGCCVWIAASSAFAEDPDPKKEQLARRRETLLAEMRSLAGQTKVAYASGQSDIRFVEQPVFRYDDQPRRFIDATMWIWTDGGRPVACQKIEARYEFNRGDPLWGYCFTSLSTDTLKAAWEGRSYASTEPGIAWQSFPDHPPPAAGNVQRKRQLRELARGFAGRMLVNPRTGESAELRLFSTPVYEYSDPRTKLPVGAVFGFEVNGTNPDLLVLIEARGTPEKPEWQFAPARMTTGGITLNYDDRKVWEAPFVEPREGPFANWLFFATSRKPSQFETLPTAKP